MAVSTPPLPDGFPERQSPERLLAPVEGASEVIGIGENERSLGVAPDIHVVRDVGEVGTKQAFHTMIRIGKSYPGVAHRSSQPGMAGHDLHEPFRGLNELATRLSQSPEQTDNKDVVSVLELGKTKLLQVRNCAKNILDKVLHPLRRIPE